MFCEIFMFSWRFSFRIKSNSVLSHSDTKQYMVVLIKRIQQKSDALFRDFFDSKRYMKYNVECYKQLFLEMGRQNNYSLTVQPDTVGPVAFESTKEKSPYIFFHIMDVDVE